MKLYSRTSSFIIGVAAIALLLGQSGPAGAAAPNRDLLAIAAASPSFVSLDQRAGRPNKVDLPSDSSGSLKVSSHNGRTLSLGLPFAEKAVGGRQIGNGLVSYDNGNGSKTVPVPQSDNSVAVHTIIESSAAPSRYAYRVEHPANGSMKMNDDGSISITDSDGTFLAGFSKPWARDAAGLSLPTSYEINGKQLVQYVDHSGSSVTYPVVADPWLGIDLIAGLPWITYTAQGAVVNLNPTPWGRQFSGIATHTAHVDELRTKLGQRGWNLTGTIQEQYLCHVVGNAFEPGTYNLESWRPWMYWGSQLNLTYRCNP